MAFISQKEINDIRNATSIVDIISTYVPLTPKGKNYFGVCPFHEDHSPSMSVSSDKQIYKCFSCGATGNVFTFVENYLNISFKEAIILIANQIGISIQTDFIQKEDRKFKKEYEIMDLSTKLYQNNLNTEQGNKAIAYLDERGLTEEIRKTFDIGLSLDKDMLHTFLNKKGYDNKILEDLGLITLKEYGAYDIFQNRIMFPIHNLDGETIGFTARCYLEETTPKYLNSKETYIFKKGNILFNYHRAKEFIRLKKEIVVVEGNMDAIRLYSSGIKNVIALMGTSITKEQITILKKTRAKIILMLDNDNAGEEATFSVGNLLLENDIVVSIVRLNGVKDPDAYILKYGADAILENINKAIPFVDFELNYLKKNKNLESSNDLAEYIKAVISNLKNNNDDILKEVTLQKLSNDYNISYALLKEQLEKGNERKSNKSQNIIEERIEKKKNSFEKLIDEVLYFMMNSGEYIKMYQEKLGMFPTKESRAIASEIIYYYETNKTINIADFITYIETTNLKKEIMDIIESVSVKVISRDAMEDLLKKLNKKINELEIKKLKDELKQEYDVNKKLELTKQIAEIKKGSVENESY